MRECKSSKWNINTIQLLIMAGSGLVFLLVFAYLPMAGISLAFKEGNKVSNLLKALLTSNWTLDNFTRLIGDEKFWSVFLNTLELNLLMLAINFPMPIIFALLIDQIKVKGARKAIQTVANFPHFISWVIMGGIVLALTDMTTGVVNPLLTALGIIDGDSMIDLNLPQYFWGKMIIVSLIKNVGWGSIIYLAAIAAINPEIYESATIDGANRFQKAMKITVPLIGPTITVFLLLNISRLLGNSFEQFYVFQTSANLSKSEVLATYIYATGFTYRNYSYASAMGLFDSLVSVTLLVSSNAISKKMTGRGIF
ncbi:MAG: ABC transporter permease subunit [Christensenellales bacterium]